MEIYSEGDLLTTRAFGVGGGEGWFSKRKAKQRLCTGYHFIDTLFLVAYHVWLVTQPSPTKKRRNTWRTRDEEERLKEELHCRVMKITRQWKSTIRTSAWEAIFLANMKKFTGKISGYLKRERVFTWLRYAVNIVCSLDTMWLRDAVVMSAHNWPDQHWVLSSSVVRASD